MGLFRVLLIVITTFLFVMFFMPVTKIIAKHIGAMDIPNQRKVHKKPIPRLGGLTMYFGFLLGYIIYKAA